MKTKTLLLLLSAGLALAQSPAVPLAASVPLSAVTPTATAAYPGYLVAMGGGYTRNNGIPNVSEAWIAAFVNIGGSLYSKTTIDMMSSVNTIRTGFCKVFSQNGNWIVGSCVDAGVQNVTPVIGSFSGGAFVTYDLKGLSKHMAGVELLGELRVTGNTATATTTSTSLDPKTGLATTIITGPAAGATSLATPGFFVGIGKTF